SLSDRVRPCRLSLFFFHAPATSEIYTLSLHDALPIFRDALGVPLPIGVPTAFLEPVADPVGDLVSSYLRTHGPFTAADAASRLRSEEHTSELQSRENLVCRLLLEKKKKKENPHHT